MKKLRLVALLAVVVVLMLLSIDNDNPWIAYMLIVLSVAVFALAACSDKEAVATVAVFGAIGGNLVVVGTGGGPMLFSCMERFLAIAIVTYATTLLWRKRWSWVALPLVVTYPLIIFFVAMSDPCNRIEGLSVRLLLYVVLVPLATIALFVVKYLSSSRATAQQPSVVKAQQEPSVGKMVGYVITNLFITLFIGVLILINVINSSSTFDTFLFICAIIFALLNIVVAIYTNKQVKVEKESLVHSFFAKVGRGVAVITSIILLLSAMLEVFRTKA